MLGLKLVDLDTGKVLIDKEVHAVTAMYEDEVEAKITTEGMLSIKGMIEMTIMSKYISYIYMGDLIESAGDALADNLYNKDGKPDFDKMHKEFERQAMRAFKRQRTKKVEGESDE